MYSSEGTGARRAPSPLLEWCRANGGEVLAVQMPGRMTRRSEPQLRTAREVAAGVLDVLGDKIGQAGGLPYVIVSHSVGGWVAFEMLRLAREKGIGMPVSWFLSAMPFPDIPEAKRPWRRQAGLEESDFKEECRGWNVNEVVFSASMWPIYHPLMRADFRLFDEYVLSPLPGDQGGQVQPFFFPIHTFWGTQDKKITTEMVQGWSRFTKSEFTCTEILGDHLWPINNAEAKTAWLTHITEGLTKILGDLQVLEAEDMF